ncbi:hypothetical protein MHBO_000558 [Bonamia ostreae]|uniref:ATP synthase F0 subunit 8 n=1 Tax=Bonamia ostreae TaxID=126728 RepID=A0ABV2AGN1_9EUKA
MELTLLLHFLKIEIAVLLFLQLLLFVISIHSVAKIRQRIKTNKKIATKDIENHRNIKISNDIEVNSKDGSNQFDFFEEIQKTNLGYVSNKYYEDLYVESED